MAHDWIDYLPPGERQAVQRRRQRQRWITRMRQRSVLIGCCLSIYLIWCLLLLLNGLVFMFSLSLLIVVGLPLIAWLAWWLVWKEYHN